jgi:superfamily I DNA/RNA helicase
VRDIEGALVRFRIPYIVRGGKGLLQTEEVKDVLAYFRLLVNPKDFPAFIRAVSVPKKGVGEVAMEKIRQLAETSHGGDLIKACGNNERLENFHDNLSSLRGGINRPASLMEEIVNVFRYKDYLSIKYGKEPSKVRTKSDNIDRFLLLVNTLVTESEMSADDLVFQLAMERPTEDDDEKGAVTISTIHSAKGLEWKRVYNTNVTEGSLPHRFSMGSPSEVEEERRLFYVACTRARDFLAICVNSLDPRGANMQPVAPSRFLGEIGINA